MGYNSKSLCILVLTNKYVLANSMRIWFLIIERKSTVLNVRIHISTIYLYQPTD